MVTNTKSDELLKAALALPEAERLRISEELLLSVPPPGGMCEGDPGFFQELDRRAQAYADGEAKTSSWEDVDARLRARLAEDRARRES